jgi:SAM-dependent methyltransferase
MLLALRPVLQVGLLVLIAWLVLRLLRGRLSTPGKVLLFVPGLLWLRTASWSVGFQFAGEPLRILAWAVAIVGGIALIRLLFRSFPFPMPWWLGPFLAGRVRGLVLPADVVLDRLALGPGMKVVEVGPGIGFLSFPAAKRLEPDGLLYCVDIQPKMIDRIRALAEARNIESIQTFVAPAEKLPDAIYDADLVFFAMVLGEVRDKRAALQEAMRVLKPGGVLSVTEALPDPHYLTRGEVRKLASQAGFEPWQTAGSFWNYTASFRKPGQPDWRRY